MNKLLAIVLLGCLVVAVSAGGFLSVGRKDKVNNGAVEDHHEDDGPPKEVDFDALNDYLRQELENVDDPAANLAHLKENINSLEGGSKKAGQMVLELANNGDECNNNIMLILEQISEAHLDLTGSRRIERVMKSAHEKALKVCASHIQQSYAQADSSLAKFWSEFNPVLLWDDMFSHQPKVLRGKLVPILARICEGDAQAKFKYYEENAETGQRKTVRDPERFEYAMNTYLLKPCERAVSDDLLLDNFLARILSQSMRTKRSKEVSELDLANEMNRMTQVKNACRQLLELSPEVRASFIKYA